MRSPKPIDGKLKGNKKLPLQLQDTYWPKTTDQKVFKRFSAKELNKASGVERNQKYWTIISVSINNEVSPRLSAKGG